MIRHRSKKKRIPKKNGRPEHEPTEDTRRIVMLAMGMNINKGDIAKFLGIAPMTLNRRYLHELTVGKTMCDLKVSEAFMRGIMKLDAKLITHYMNNRMAGWSDKKSVDVTSDGDAIKVVTMSLGDKKALDDLAEELNALPAPAAL